MGIFNLDEVNIGVDVGVATQIMSATSASQESVKVENKEEEESVVATPEVDIETASIERPTVESILSSFKSGIGLDIAKNHTGIALWRDGKLETLGFAIDMEYDDSSYLAEAKMRKWFKDKMREILRGYDWEVCIIEDVYGGVNFSTTRKLLALNCVVDELLLEGDISIGNLYRFKETEWMKDLRTIYKVSTKLNPKYECEQILKYLGFDLVLREENSSQANKERIFYEDRCDATGQLLSLAMHLLSNVREVKSSSVRLSNIQVYFFEDLYDHPEVDDLVLEEFMINVCTDFNVNNIEGSIIKCLSENKGVYSVYLSTDQLGTFGIRNGYSFYEQGYGYLVFYNKALRKLL